MEVQASFLITPQLNLNNPALYATTPSLFKRIAVVAFLFSFVHNYLRMKYSIPECTKMKCVLVCRQFSFNLLDQPLVGTLPCAFHQGFPFFHINASAVRFVNCQIELHQPNKNPHRSNASPTSLTQSLYYIYKMSLNLIIRTDVYRETNTVRGLLRTLYYIYKNTLNLFLNFCLSYQDRAKHSSKPINKHQQKWLKLFLLEGKKSS